MAYEYHITDVFTDRPFSGNQLAVLTDARGLSDQQMATIAREFNFSETVFFFPPENPANTRRVRIFTPASELDFAGHPTIGAAFVLAASGMVELAGPETRIVLEENVGPVPVLIRSENGHPVFAQLTAAKIPERGTEKYDAATLAAVLSLELEAVTLDGGYGIEWWTVGVPYLYVPLRDADALLRARISMDHWEKTLRDTPAPELYLFTEEEASAARDGVRSGDGVIRARMYAPALGIMEDPATGSAAAAMGGYLASRSNKKDGMLRYTIHQGVEMGRASRLEVEVDVAAGAVLAVRVGGASVLISSGVLHVP